MESNPEGLKHRELTEKIIGVFYDVYNELGHGFLETIYEQALAIALAQQVGDFRADMRVDGKVLLEIKAARAIDQAHEKQLLNYLRATDIEVGLLLNFGVKPQFRRLVYENERKKIRVDPRESAAS
jgi:hypothetical protein